MSVASLTCTNGSPSSSVHTVALENPKLKISGIEGGAVVDMYLSMDGSNPDSTDKALTFKKDTVVEL